MGRLERILRLGCADSVICSIAVDDPRMLLLAAVSSGASERRLFWN